MSIIFYEMPGCYYCVKSKDLFKDEITKGMIVVKPSSQAPPGVSGFPFFVNPQNGITHTGFPGDKSTLYNKLQVNAGVEQFQYRQNVQPSFHNYVQQQHVCPKCNLPKY